MIQVVLRDTGKVVSYKRLTAKINKIMGTSGAEVLNILADNKVINKKLSPVQERFLCWCKARYEVVGNETKCNMLPFGEFSPYNSWLTDYRNDTDSELGSGYNMRREAEYHLRSRLAIAVLQVHDDLLTEGVSITPEQNRELREKIAEYSNDLVEKLLIKILVP